MNEIHRWRIFSIGAIGWVIVAAQGMEHLPMSATLGSMHAGIAGAIVGLSLMPRRMIRWAD